LEDAGWGIQVRDLQRRAESHAYYHTYTYSEFYPNGHAESDRDTDSNPGSNTYSFTYAASLRWSGDCHRHGRNGGPDGLRNGESGV
jgi:hypothetical protein